MPSGSSTRPSATLPPLSVPVPALVYVAGRDNPNYLGPAPLPEIAVQVHRSAGPSGSNREYVLRLAEALRAIRAHDAHVFDLEALLADETRP